MNLTCLAMCVFFVCNRVNYDYYKYHSMPEVRATINCSIAHIHMPLYKCIYTYIYIYILYLLYRSPIG